MSITDGNKNDNYYKTEIRRLEDRVKALEERNRELLALIGINDGTLESARKALTPAQRIASGIIGDALNQAESIIADAKAQNEQLASEYNDKIAVKHREFTDTCARVDAFKRSILTQYAEHISQLEKLVYLPLSDYPAEPAKPVETVKEAEPAKPAEPVKEAEPAKPAEPAKEAEPAKPVEPAKAAQTADDSGDGDSEIAMEFIPEEPETTEAAEKTGEEDQNSAGDRQTDIFDLEPETETEPETNPGQSADGVTVKTALEDINAIYSHPDGQRTIPEVKREDGIPGEPKRSFSDIKSMLTGIEQKNKGGKK